MIRLKFSNILKSPGTGKNYFGRNYLKKIREVGNFLKFLAVSRCKEVRDVIEDAKKQKSFFSGNLPFCFIDEIHRFYKSQQDSFASISG